MKVMSLNGGGIRGALPVKFAFECPECECCGEPWCDECKTHYAECAHPGPHSETDETRAPGGQESNP